MESRSACERRGRRWLMILAWSGCLLTFPLGSLAGEGAPGAEGGGSLRPLLEQADRNAQSADGADAARAQYQAIVETHLANEAVFHDALRRMADDYEKTGRVEEGIRYFVSHVDAMERSARGKVLQEIFTGFRLKHPDLLQKVVQEVTGSRPAAIPPEASKDLAQAIVQRGDPELRARALAKLLAMLAADTPASEKKTALATLGRSLTAKFDRASFHALVVPLLESEEAELRWLAVGCLPGLEPEAADLDRVARLAGDPDARVRSAVGGALIGLGQGERGEVVIPALMKLLRDPEEQVVEQTVRSMWGQYASPEFDALAIELSHKPPHQHNVIYFVLSTMRTKSVAVCRRLVEELDDPDWNNSYRAAWGLTYGVPEEARSLVEEGLLRALPEETNPQTRKQEFTALRGVATAKSRAYLTSVVDSPSETDAFQEQARAILSGLAP